MRIEQPVCYCTQGCGRNGLGTLRVQDGLLHVSVISEVLSCRGRSGMDEV